MDQVHLLRLDQAGGMAPGNKSFKLRYNLAQAKQRGIGRIVSFGGGWSNHLHALAAVGQELGLETIGLVRGEEGDKDTPTLVDAHAWGMKLERVSRSDYRRRNDPEYLAQVEERFQPCLVIPEGGANVEGLRGCMGIAENLLANWQGSGTVVVPVGTGTTLAGLVAGLSPPLSVLGISALKGANDLEQRVEGLLAASANEAVVPWRIEHAFHCGGFARANESLRHFMQEFERLQRIPLDPVYNGKMLYAVHQLLAEGALEGPLLAIHTGGLQGRRGYDWLEP